MRIKLFFALALTVLLTVVSGEETVTGAQASIGTRRQTVTGR